VYSMVKVLINKKEVEIRELIDLFNDIWLIVNDRCGYCKRKNINKCEDKLILIRNLIKNKGWLE